MFDNVIIVEAKTIETREGEFVTHDGRPVPAGLPCVVHVDGHDLTEWYEVRMVAFTGDDGLDYFEWVECKRVADA